jgi:hypothetical protein
MAAMLQFLVLLGVALSAMLLVAGFGGRRRSRAISRPMGLAAARHGR